MEAFVQSFWSAFLLLPIALLLDRLFGEPPARVHPVCAMGSLAVCMERFCRWLFLCPARDATDAPATDAQARREFWAGLVAGILVLLPFMGGAFALGMLLSCWHEVAAFCWAAFCIYICLAPRSLAEHALRVASPLERDDLAGARKAVSMIVGRCPEYLDAYGVARAAVESVAENMTDGVLGSLFWALCGGLCLGLPGAAAFAVLQRVANTLDAMWGRKDAAYAHFGTFGARLDDVTGFFPARLALPCTALAALFLPGADARGALCMGFFYRHAHESPNSAYSEAAFAGALGLRLGGPAIYPRGLVPHPWLGEGRAQATGADIRKAVTLMLATVWLFGLLCAAFWLCCL